MKLLSAALDFGKKFTELTSIGRLATVGILVSSTYYFATCSNSKNIEQLNVLVEETVEVNNKLKDSVGVLKTTVDGKEVTIKRLNIQISILSTERKILQTDQNRFEKILETETDTGVIVAIQDSTINNLKTQLKVTDEIIDSKDQIIDEKTHQINLLTTSLSLTEQRADTLHTVLNKTLYELNKKDKAFGFIPLPSRKVVAATAFVGGVYLGTQIKK